ncbi:MAG: FAD-binding oxidoreductase [Hyphomicrobiales bacterium]|nr:FAD-binding oxidoreductase [Hyphomicrobiales bacterium]
MSQNVDVMVLGAGIVGTASALQIQAKGRLVALIDLAGEAGRETSYGNAGLIERSSLTPYLLPMEPLTLLRYALNSAPQVHYHVNALIETLPWIIAYGLNSRAAAKARIGAALLPVISACVTEHQVLMKAAGALDLCRPTGWIKLFRSERELAKAAHEAEGLRAAGLTIDQLGLADLARLEPDLHGGIGALHYRDPAFVPDPLGLTTAYARHFEHSGGVMLSGDARGLEQTSDGWRLMTSSGGLTARQVLLALGPWSAEILRPLGYRVPLGIKRGYHMHYATQPGAKLNHPVLDDEGGYLLAPMNQGIRLTTGAEFARFEAPPTPVQLNAVEPVARKLFPLASRLDKDVWMGRRPCLPDMMPVLGEAPRHKGLWLNFGHQHHGLTLAAVTGRLVAEMMTGETPFANPAPFAITRFQR